MMRSKKIVVPLLLVLVLAALSLLIINECAFGGGMGAAYKSCDCAGIEHELYDQTAADGPRKTICIGIIRSTRCYQTMGGPIIECASK